MSLRLFPYDAVDFTGAGKGILKEIRNDEVHEILNGIFELNFQYPVAGRLNEEIFNGEIVTAKPNDVSPPQPFRIYRVKKAIGGWVTVYARHLYYDLKNYVCEPFQAPIGQVWAEAAPLIQEHIFPECPFSFHSDEDSDDPRWDMREPMAVWDMLTPGKNLLRGYDDIELEPDGLSVGLMHKGRGSDRGVSIRYGQNLRDLTMEITRSATALGVYPYLYDEDENLVQLPERYLIPSLAENLALPVHIAPLPVEVMLSDAYTIENWGSLEGYLRFRGKMEADILFWSSVAERSLDIDFVQLSKTTEYANHPLPDGIGMGDIVRVEHPSLGVGDSVRVTEIRYQPSTGKYKKIVLGEPKRNVLRTLAKR